MINLKMLTKKSCIYMLHILIVTLFAFSGMNQIADASLNRDGESAIDNVNGNKDNDNTSNNGHKTNPVQTAEQNPAMFDSVRKAIVKITCNISLSPTSPGAVVSGTGFIIDKKDGYIITNAHVIGRSNIGTYFATFDNGRQAEVKLIYYDVWQDFAVLRVVKKDLDLISVQKEIRLSSKKLELYDSVFVINNSENQDFSLHDGYVSNLYSIKGGMPQMSYVINLNISGGASGSPVLNKDMEAVALLYGKGQSYAHALYIDYIKNVINDIKSNKMPVRRHIGALTTNYSLDAAMRHRKFPRNMVSEYIEKYPDSRNYAIMISDIIPGTPNADKLRVGDIIWKMDGKEIHGDLLKMDTMMDQFKGEDIDIEIYRDGKNIKQKVKLYNINDVRVDRLVDFGGGCFFIADDYISSITSIPRGSLSIVFVQNGPLAPLNEGTSMIRVQPYMIGDLPVSNLDDLRKAIDKAVKDRFTSIRYRTYSIYWREYLETFYSRQDGIADIMLDDTLKSITEYKYDHKKQEWISETILGS